MTARKFLLFSIGMLATGPSWSAQATVDPVSATSLWREPCTVEQVSGPRLPSAFRVDANLRCGGRQVGRAASMGLPASSPATPTAMEMEPLRQFLAPASAIDCELAKPLPDAADTLVFPCRQRADGFPTLVLARKQGSKLVAISGPASVYPVLRATIGLPAVEGSLTEQKAQLTSLWTSPVVIASATDEAFIQARRDQARLANGRFAFADADKALREALELQIKLFGERDFVAAAILMDLAMVVANEGRFDEAERLLQRAGPIIETSPRASDRARLAGYQANVALLRSDPAQAGDAARAATAQWRTIASAPPITDEGQSNPLADPLAQAELAMALNREAGLLQQAEDPASANARASEALLLLDKSTGAPPWWRADILVNLATSSVALGRLSAGEAYFKAAIDLRRQTFGEDPATLRMRIALARAYQGEGLHTSAIVAYRDALAIARALPRGSVPFTAEDLVPLAAAVVDYAAQIDDPAARQGLFAEAFDAFQLAAAPGRDRTVALATQRLASTSKGLNDLLRQIADDESAQSQARDAVAREQALPADERDAGQLATYRQQLKQAEDHLAETRKTLATRYPDHQALLSPPLPSLDSVRARLADGEALLTILVGRKESFVQVVKRTGLTLARAPLGKDELRDAVQHLRRGLEIEGKSVADFDLAASHHLFTQLLGPVSRELTGTRRLIVIPSGPLASLPLEVLVTKPSRAGDYAGSHWLIQDLAITHSPSLASFMSLRSTKLTQNPPHRLLAVADPLLGAPTASKKPLPALSGACRSDAPVSPELLRSLPPLPDTLREVSSVANALDRHATLLTGREANEQNLRKQALADYRILYFASHGVVPGELKCQAEPGLVLTPPDEAATTRATDGMLDASEIATLDIRADLVVLSACNTAGVDNSAPMGGETLSGLALAFFHAGARNLVVSHWQVPSAATAGLMTNVFSSMNANAATAIDEALRDAQLKVIASRTNAHPFFWGAFVVLGDGAATPLQERTTR